MSEFATDDRMDIPQGLKSVLENSISKLSPAGTAEDFPGFRRGLFPAVPAGLVVLANPYPGLRPGLSSAVPVQIRFEKRLGSETNLYGTVGLSFVIPSEAEGSAVPRTSPGSAEYYAQTELSSRPERTRISCHAALDKTACAPFLKERCTPRPSFIRLTLKLAAI